MSVYETNAYYSNRYGWTLKKNPNDCGTCKICGHDCHCATGSVCCSTDCHCNDCDHQEEIKSEYT